MKDGPQQEEGGKPGICPTEFLEELKSKIGRKCTKY
jgi:hypothetical protein